MSEIKPPSRVQAKPVGFCSSLATARVVRAYQFVITVIALALTARTSDFYEAPSEAAYAVAVSVFSLVYLIAIFFGTLFAGPYFMAGPMLLSETVMLIFWFSAFIAMAAFFGGDNCSYFFYENRCKEAKAAIAMCALCMALFAISLALLVINAVIPLSKSFGALYLWRWVLDADATFDRGTGLVIYSTLSWAPDTEAVVPASSLETPIGAEKPVEEDQALFREPLGEPLGEPVVVEPVDVPANAHIR